MEKLKPVHTQIVNEQITINHEIKKRFYVTHLPNTITVLSKTFNVEIRTYINDNDAIDKYVVMCKTINGVLIRKTFYNAESITMLKIIDMIISAFPDKTNQEILELALAKVTM